MCENKDNVTLVLYANQLRDYLLKDSTKRVFVYGREDQKVEYKRVTHGRWIEHHEPFTWMGYTTWTCSVCGYECGYEKEIGFRTSCCPNCGALMDEEDK